MDAIAIGRDFLKIPKTTLLLSAALHGGILLMLSTAHLLDRFGISLWPKSLETKRVYQDFIQVDVVALPDHMLGDKIDTTVPIIDKPLSPPEPLVSPVEEEVIEDPQEIKKAAEKKAKESAAAREKERKEKLIKEQEEALKKLKAEAAREKALKALTLNEGQIGRVQLKGNKLSQGTSTSGLIGAPKDRYAALVKKAIQERFSVYPWQKKKKLVALVYIEIMSSGRIREKRLLKSSADSVYDSAVLQAIESAQPLPVPEDLNLLSDGITLEFKPEE